jgi:hypothetical protein
MTRPTPAGSAMILKMGMKTCPNARMLFICSVRVVTRNLKPVQQKKNALYVIYSKLKIQT